MSFYEFILQLGFWQWIAIIIVVSTIFDAIPRTVKAVRKGRQEKPQSGKGA